MSQYITSNLVILCQPLPSPDASTRSRKHRARQLTVVRTFTVVPATRCERPRPSQVRQRTTGCVVRVRVRLLPVWSAPAHSCPRQLVVRRSSLHIRAAALERGTSVWSAIDSHGGGWMAWGQVPLAGSGLVSARWASRRAGRLEAPRRGPRKSATFDHSRRQVEQLEVCDHLHRLHRRSSPSVARRRRASVATVASLGSMMSPRPPEEVDGPAAVAARRRRRMRLSLHP
jgi:hypothetical protein